ncbi:PfkB family carbohydrate kinase [Nocardia sp. NPDC047038]|uniref:PfkB family carbohydrate kinase n=1 Tax=Nocardia sp. NPDC047038 TaxID=3154338 RepID=UPI0033FB6E65
MVAGCSVSGRGAVAQGGTFSNRLARHFAVQPVDEVVDPTGAGDAFTMYFAASKVTGSSIERAIKNAPAAAAYSIQRSGDASPCRPVPLAGRDVALPGAGYPVRRTSPQPGRLTQPVLELRPVPVHLVPVQPRPVALPSSPTHHLVPLLQSRFAPPTSLTHPTVCTTSKTAGRRGKPGRTAGCGWQSIHGCP